MARFLTFYLFLSALAIPQNLLGRAVVSIDPATIASPEVGQELDIKVQIADGKGVAGYQFTLSYDQSALEYNTIKNGDYLQPGA